MIGKFIDLVGGWGNLIAWGINGIFAWVLWSLRRQFATHSEVEAVELELRKLVNEQDKRLVVVEHVIADIPNKIDKLIVTVSAQDANIVSLTSQIERMGQQVNMLLRHEMEDVRK